MSDIQDRDEGDIDEGVKRTVARKPAAGKDDVHGEKKGGEEDDDEIEVIDTEDEGAARKARAADDDDGEEDDDEGRERHTSESRTERNRRRAKERKDRRREAERADKRIIAEQGETIAELKARLERVEGHVTAQDKANLDQRLADTDTAIENLRQRRLHALSESRPEDADRYDRAIDELRDQRAELRAMKKAGEKKSANGDGADRGNGGGGKVRFTPADNRAISAFLDDHDWIDPEGRDRDSRKALAIDAEMVQEGFRPSDPDWKQELESRLRKALPDQFEDADDDDRRSTRRRSPPTGNRGRESDRGGLQVRPTPERKQMLADGNHEKGSPELQAHFSKHGPKPTRRQRRSARLTLQPAGDRPSRDRHEGLSCSNDPRPTTRENNASRNDQRGAIVDERRAIDRDEDLDGDRMRVREAEWEETILPEPAPYQGLPGSGCRPPTPTTASTAAAMGYVLVKASDIPASADYSTVKSGRFDGLVSCAKSSSSRRSPRNAPRR